MPRGGKRASAGRKPGSTTKKKRAIAVQAAAEGITPLEVMLDAMRRHHKAKKWDKAAAIAKDAAPYIHPRLSATQHSGKLKLSGKVTIEETTAAGKELEEFLRERRQQKPDA